MKIQGIFSTKKVKSLVLQFLLIIVNKIRLKITLINPKLVSDNNGQEYMTAP